MIKAKDFILRNIKLSDLSGYFECQKDPLTKRGFMSTPKNLFEAKKELQMKIADSKKKKPFGECFAIIVHGEFAGYIEIHDLNKIFQEHSGSIDYCIHPRFRGNNLAFKSLKILTDYAFKKYSLKRIDAGVRSFNKASIRTLEKVGYKLEGTLKKYYYRNGKYSDNMIFAKLK